jgi:two-component system, chemotaxis family, chemotaxis protein CheY
MTASTDIAPVRPSQDPASGPTILVIDDDPLVLRTIERILQRRGYRVCLAADGSQGLTAFRCAQPDLVITDVVMPVQNGLDTIRLLLRSSPSAKIIAISGGNRASKRDLLAAALAIGASATIIKPFAPEELLSMVSANLHGGEFAVERTPRPRAPG